MKAVPILAAALALVLSAGAASAQTGQTLRDKLVGTWDFVIAEITTTDGKKTFPFGEHPKGLLIFTAEGRFSQVHISGDLPKIASNNRLAGTDADNRAIVAGSLCLIGTYDVDENKEDADLPHRREHLPDSGRHLADPHHRPPHRGRIPQHQPRRGARYPAVAGELLPASEVAGALIRSPRRRAAGTSRGL